MRRSRRSSAPSARWKTYAAWRSPARVARERRLVDGRGVPVVQRLPDARPARVGGRRERERGDAGQRGDQPPLRFPVHRRDAIRTGPGWQGPHGDRYALLRRLGAPPRPPRRSRAAARAGGTGTPRSPRAASAPPMSRARRRARPRSARGRACGASRASASAIEPAQGSRTWSRMAGKGRPRVGRRVAPGVLAVQRGAVVDQPEPPVPGEQVGVLRRAVDVRGQRVEPDDRGGELGRRLGADGRRVGQRAGEEVEPDVAARRGVDELLDLAVGLGAAQLRVELHEDDLRHGQARSRAPARRPRARRPAPSAPARRRGT